MSHDTLTLYNKEFAERQEEIRKMSEERRRQETPKGYTKRKPIGKDKDTGEELFADTPTREYAQRWLDDKFPGWSIVEFKPEVLTVSRNEGGKTVTYPGIFTCFLVLQVVEANGMVRRVAGTGAAPVSLKEIARDNTSLLQYKPIVAYTNALKNAASWLGFAFDLRVDEEQIDRMSQPPSEDDENRLNTLLSLIPNENTKSEIRKRFNQQNAVSVHEFLNNLERKINQKRKEKENNDRRNQESNGEPVGGEARGESG